MGALVVYHGFLQAHGLSIAKDAQRHGPMRIDMGTVLDFLTSSGIWGVPCETQVRQQI